MLGSAGLFATGAAVVRAAADTAEASPPRARDVERPAAGAEARGARLARVAAPAAAGDTPTAVGVHVSSAFLKDIKSFFSDFFINVPGDRLASVARVASVLTAAGAATEGDVSAATDAEVWTAGLAAGADVATAPRGTDLGRTRETDTMVTPTPPLAVPRPTAGAGAGLPTAAAEAGAAAAPPALAALEAPPAQGIVNMTVCVTVEAAAVMVTVGAAPVPNTVVVTKDSCG